MANWNYKSQQIIGTNTWIADWSLSLDWSYCRPCWIYSECTTSS